MSHSLHRKEVCSGGQTIGVQINLQREISYEFDLVDQVKLGFGFVS